MNLHFAHIWHRITSNKRNNNNNCRAITRFLWTFFGKLFVRFSKFGMPCTQCERGIYGFCQSVCIHDFLRHIYSWSVSIDELINIYIDIGFVAYRFGYFGITREIWELTLSNLACSCLYRMYTWKSFHIFEVFPVCPLKQNFAVLNSFWKLELWALVYAHFFMPYLSAENLIKIARLTPELFKNACPISCKEEA